MANVDDPSIKPILSESMRRLCDMIANIAWKVWIGSHDVGHDLTSDLAKITAYDVHICSVNVQAI